MARPRLRFMVLEKRFGLTFIELLSIRVGGSRYDIYERFRGALKTLRVRLSP